MKNPLLQKRIKAMPLTDRGEELLEIANNEVLEEVDIGNYELYLVFDANFGFCQLGMQRAGQDFTDMEQQARHIIPRFWGRFDRRAFKRTITRWLQQHHLLMIGSHDAHKTRLYRVALRALGIGTRNTAHGRIAYLEDGQQDPSIVQRLEQITRILEEEAVLDARTRA
jgi:hypothetical protein